MAANNQIMRLIRHLNVDDRLLAYHIPQVGDRMVMIGNDGRVNVDYMCPWDQGGNDEETHMEYANEALIEARAQFVIVRLEEPYLEMSWRDIEAEDVFVLNKQAIDIASNYLLTLPNRDPLAALVHGMSMASDEHVHDIFHIIHWLRSNAATLVRPA